MQAKRNHQTQYFIQLPRSTITCKGGKICTMSSSMAKVLRTNNFSILVECLIQQAVRSSGWGQWRREGSLIQWSEGGKGSEQVTSITDTEKWWSQKQNEQQYSSTGTTALSWQQGYTLIQVCSQKTTSGSHAVKFYYTIYMNNNNKGVFCFSLSTSPRTPHIHPNAYFFIGLCFQHVEANATKPLYQLRTYAFLFPKRNAMPRLERCSVVTMIKVAHTEIKYYYFVIRT